MGFYNCPHCNQKIDEKIHDRWCDNDYNANFITTCPNCEELIDVEVHQVPEFHFRKVIKSNHRMQAI